MSSARLTVVRRRRSRRWRWPSRRTWRPVRPSTSRDRRPSSGRPGGPRPSTYSDPRGAVDRHGATRLHPAARQPISIDGGSRRWPSACSANSRRAGRPGRSWHVHAEAHAQVRDAVPADRVAEAVGWVVDDVTEVVGQPHPGPRPDRRAGRAVSLGRDERLPPHRTRPLHHRPVSLTPRRASSQPAGASTRWRGRLTTSSWPSWPPDSTAYRAQRRPGALVPRWPPAVRRVQLALAPAGAGQDDRDAGPRGGVDRGGAQCLGLAPRRRPRPRSATRPACRARRSPSSSTTSTRPDSDLVARIGPDTLVVSTRPAWPTPSPSTVIGFAVERGRDRAADRRRPAARRHRRRWGACATSPARRAPSRLDEVVRFVEPVEAEASLALRDGDRAALGYYLDHERIHVGDVRRRRRGLRRVAT